MSARLAAAFAAAPPLSQRLRAETQAAHAAIERNRRFARLMAPDLGAGEYRALVGRLFGHHAPAEAALERAGQWLPGELDLDRRLRRRALLAGDLLALGLAPADIEALPLCRVAPIHRAEEAWGLLYVLEGSTLGGQVIARHLSAVLGLDAASGAGAMAPHGAETGAMWRGFKAALDRAPLDAAAVIAAARRCFLALDDWMDRA